MKTRMLVTPALQVAVSGKTYHALREQLGNKRHWQAIVACDCFTVEVLTWTGITRFYVMFLHFYRHQTA